MKQIQRRLLAGILSIVMLIGMCPFSFAAAEDAVTYTYNYQKLKWGQWSDNGYAPDYVTSFDMTTAGSTSELDDYNNVTTEPWMFDSYGTGATGSWTKSSTAYGIYLSGPVGSYAAFRIRVPMDAKYHLISRHSLFSTGGNIAFYLAPADAEDPRAEEFYLNTIETFNVSLVGNAEEDVATKDLASGDYILSYVFTESDSGVTTPGLYTNAFILQGVLKEYQVSAPPISVVAGEKTAQELVLTYGEEIADFSDLSECSVVSENPEIADVQMVRSDDGTKLYLSAEGKSVGTTPVTMLLKIGAKVLEVQTEITVSGGEFPFVLEHDGESVCNLQAGMSSEYHFNATYRGNALDLNNANVTVSTDETVASASVEKHIDGSATLRITGKAEGAAKVLVTAYYEGRSANFSVSLTVRPRVEVYRYNFLKLHYGPWSNDGFDPKIVTSFRMTTAGDSAEINTEIPSDPWMYDSSDNPASLSWTSSSAGKGPSWITKPGGWCRYRIRVSESDAYVPEIVFAKYSNCGQVTVYLAPADAFNPADEQYRLGTANAYSSSLLTEQKEDFRRTYLEAGDYVLTLVMGGTSTTDLAFFMTEFTLTKPAVDTPYLYVPVERPVGVGYTDRFAIHVEKNGIPFDLSNATRIRAQSSKSSIATVTVVTSEDGSSAELEIKGVSPGNTAFTVIVIIAGKTHIYSGWVSVKAADAVGQVALTLSSETLNAGESGKLDLVAYSFEGNVIDHEELEISYLSSDPTVADVDENGVISAYNQGAVTFRAVISDAYSLISVVSPIFTVEGYSPLETVSIASEGFLQKGGTLKLSVDATLEHGAAMPLDQANITYQIVSVSPSGAATLSGDTLTGVANGTVTVKATVTFGGVTMTTPDQLIYIRAGKTRSSYYTEERRRIARENYDTYEWAKRAVDATLSVADKLVGREEEFWNMVTTQELPRNIRVGYRFDPNHHICRYCGVDIVSLVGSNYAFKYNVDANPWKVQCPACARYFPSNDFEKFYKTGIDENGNWSYDLALKNGSQHLTNDLYPEKGTGWGVDDGYGYRTGKMFNTGEGRTWEETHTYISYYNHWALWYNGYIIKAMNNSALAYVYSGDPKYGRVAAILVDRIADIYPEMDTGTYDPKYWNNGWYGGKILGGIWETGNAIDIARAYDAVFDLYDDPEVISFLSGKASKYKMTNGKKNGNEIRQNIDDNFLREAIAAHYDKRIYGNFGFHQKSAAYLAVVLDTLPETSQLLDWMLDGAGAVNSTVLANVSRDGAGNESSPTYNFGWASSMQGIMDALEGYDKYSKADLYNNPKIIKMFKMNFPMTLLRKTTAQIGDSTGVDVHSYSYNATSFIAPFMASGDIELGQMIYFLNGNKTTGLNSGIFTDTTKLQKMLNDVIVEHGEYPFDKSVQMTDYGFSILKDGTLSGKKDTQRDVWMKYGITDGHGHPAKLNLGIDAFGLCLAPDMGYPSTTLGTGDIVNWERSTIIHNTIQVNNANQAKNLYNAKPLHFDDNGFVKVMDVDAGTNAYSATSIYRRTVIMVNAGEEDSYAVDFFRVKGGNTHVYSFHALSESVAETAGLNLVSQSGTYAGKNVAYGPGNVSSGHDGLTSVMIDTSPDQKFTVDFAIRDFRGHATRSGNLHLRMTQINNFTPDNVATALGRPPILNTNPKWLQFALVKRTGTNLDSFFTTVFEPYCNERFIASEETVSMIPIGGATAGANDVARAVKVTLKNGRVDYIVHATNNQILYRVDDLFDFMGAIGVYSLQDGVPVHEYVCDGTVIGENQSTISAYTGKVVDFTKGLAFENHIQVSFDQAVDFDDLVGRYINVNNNNSTYNACYEIKGVTKLTNTTAKLHIGDITFVRGRIGTYDIAVNQTFKIPLSTEFEEEEGGGGEETPETPSFAFDPISSQTAHYGVPYTLQVRAESKNGGMISYRMIEGPEGATFDTTTATMSWTPNGFDETFATFEAQSAGETAQITVPISVSVAPPSLVYGAQIRLTGVQGIRFIAMMDFEMLDILKEQGATDIEYGTLLIPSADVQRTDDIKIGATLNGHAVAKVPAVFLYDITDSAYVYTAVITNILPANYKRAYTARAYLSYNDANGVSRVVYGDTCVSRSIYQIAKAALNESDRYSEEELAVLQAIVDSVEQ